MPIVFVVIQLFRLECIKALNDFYSGIVDPLIFIHELSRLFMSVKGYGVYMKNKIINGCL